jgi:hypothetical protein
VTRTSKLLWFSLGAFVCLAGSASAQETGGRLMGRVLADSRGLEAVRVYAYQLVDLSLQQVWSGGDGSFQFEGLPSGLYKLIAYKAGFQPVIVMVSRASAEVRQFVELQLPRATANSASDFWKLRGQVPADVLRDIEQNEIAGRETRELHSATVAPEGRYQAHMSTMQGVRQDSARHASVTQSQLDVATQVGGTQVGVIGRYSLLTGSAPASRDVAIAGGQARSLSVRVGADERQSVSLAGLSHRMTMQRGERNSAAGLDRYSVSWDRALGESGRSSVRAEYVDEDGLFGRGLARSQAIAEASRTMRVEGSYATLLSGRHSLETGLRYRQRDEIFDRSRPGEIAASERVELFGRAGVQMGSAFFMEYGIYSALQDGSVSLSPRGSLIVQLSKNWQASTSLSQRVQTSSTSTSPDFLQTWVQRGEDITQASAQEYQLAVSRQIGAPEDQISLGATHRRFGDNLRLYFSDNLFDYAENLYFVPGDALPELQFSVARHLTPKLATRVQTSWAAGGGGVVATADDRLFENAIRYVLTSVDTRYLPTSTGLFVAFHRIEQDLEPLFAAGRLAAKGSELESLEFVLTQDLGVLLDLASAWELRLDVEFSRGTDPLRPHREDEIRSRLLGGLSIKF